MTQEKSTIAAIRYGYGFRADQMTPKGADDLLAQLSGPDDWLTALPTFTWKERHKRFVDFKKAAKKRDRNNAETEAAFRAIKQARNAVRLQDSRALFGRAILSDQGFRERLAAFWLDHFTVAPRSNQGRGIWGHYIDHAIRPHITGRFADLLRAADTHASMLMYLNQTASFGPNSVTGQEKGKGLNENLAREMLELHTLGVGAGYTQTDINQLAELLTGFIASQDGSRYLSRIAEPGAETVLGKTYGGHRMPHRKEVDPIFEDLSVHPATARHIARKLVVHFVSDTPDADHVAHVAAAWDRSGGDLMAVYAALLEHPAAFAPLGDKIKQPFDMVVSSYRALGLGQPAIARFGREEIQQRFELPVASMGQMVRNAPAPSGWPEEASAWVTPQGVAGRMQFALQAGLNYGAEVDPRDFVALALRDFAGESLIFSAGAAVSRAEGVALVLASPEFNKR